ncbi:hypothetical protein F4604DRAFT_1689834 [Suillus subluteus]|nr:hypothetical protein F4604DRAFT_1689834 [Suillus subluteus]
MTVVTSTMVDSGRAISGFEQFPRWRDLKHPNQVISVTFTDSSVHEDISKCVRLYLEMDMYAALEVHTTNTSRRGDILSKCSQALMKTNFKNVAEQILRINHWILVADDIDHRISDFDEYSQRKSDGDSEDDDSLDDDEIPTSAWNSTLDPSQR